MTTHKLANPLDDEEFLAIFGYKAPMDAVSLVDNDPEVVTDLKELFGEAGHLFECHADGTWAGPEGHKDRLALRLCEILRTRPNLAHRLIKADNRVVKMITYRALEICKET